VTAMMFMLPLCEYKAVSVGIIVSLFYIYCKEAIFMGWIILLK
jgi:hypothetical protein